MKPWLINSLNANACKCRNLCETQKHLFYIRRRSQTPSTFDATSALWQQINEWLFVFLRSQETTHKYNWFLESRVTHIVCTCPTVNVCYLRFTYSHFSVWMMRECSNSQMRIVRFAAHTNHNIPRPPDSLIFLFFPFVTGASIKFQTIQHVHGISDQKFGDEINAHRSSGDVGNDADDTIDISRPYELPASHKIQPFKHHTTQMTVAKDAAETDSASIAIPDVSSNEQILYFANPNPNLSPNANSNNNNVKSKSFRVGTP